MKIKTLKKAIVILVSCLLVVFIAEEVLRRVLGGFAGSYPFVESWNIAAKEEDVIKAIEALKAENPALKPPHDTSYRNSYWYYVDFYYADTKQIAHAWTRPGNNEFTTDLALVSFSGINPNDDNKLINKDFWYWANKNAINKFKAAIVDKIEARVYKPK